MSQETFITIIIALVSALFGAIIGGIFTLSGVVWQSLLQIRLEKDKKNEAERNKLIHIDFLIKDSFKYIEIFKKNTENFSFGNNRYDMSTLPPTLSKNISLEVLISQVDYEKYYTAFYNQLQDDSFRELLFFANKLYDKINETIDRYNRLFPKLINDRNLYFFTLQNYIREIKFYINRNKNQQLSSNRRITFDKINIVLLDIIVLENINSDPAHVANHMRPFFDRMIEILKDTSELDEYNLYVLTWQTFDKYFDYDWSWAYLANWLVTDRSQSIDFAGR